jgi:hypothetical protein
MCSSEEELTMLETGMLAREKARFESERYLSVEDNPLVEEYREEGWDVLLSVRAKHPRYFKDTTIFALSIAYMDRVLACNVAQVPMAEALKKTAVLPLACLWVAMKVYVCWFSDHRCASL